ncbi:HPr family phosphocarrier protein [Novosphingobium sp.]|uniref:HPr family phosphocarrier protein n=1 Tax=Novosphingobium sp. TaxID=1874826 RepID=UPI002B482A09|nr:HPr family phosphocarrier protein [Novosphingobium sp.]HKR90871.1 HPr family phosphocarrier protein [Novosphingobium sp.]
MIDCRESVLIVNKRGLHARASAKFVNHVADLPQSVAVIVTKDGTSASGGSILGLMMLGAAKGDTIEISCSGDGAEAALTALATLVKGGFGEE